VVVASSESVAATEVVGVTTSRATEEIEASVVTREAGIVAAVEATTTGREKAAMVAAETGSAVHSSSHLETGNQSTQTHSRIPTLLCTRRPTSQPTPMLQEQASSIR